MKKTNNITEKANTQESTSKVFNGYMSQRRSNDIIDAVEKTTELAETDCRVREIAAHLIMAVLSRAKEVFSITVEEHGTQEENEKSKVICGVLDVLTDLYEGTDEDFDIYDYAPSGDADELVVHLADKMTELC